MTRGMRWLCLVAVAVAIVVAGCGGSSPSTTTTTTTTAAVKTTHTTTSKTTTSKTTTTTTAAAKTTSTTTTGTAGIPLAGRPTLAECNTVAKSYTSLLATALGGSAAASLASDVKAVCKKYASGDIKGAKALGVALCNQFASVAPSTLKSAIQAECKRLG